jgi:ribosomal protein S18 acetylase RimI-like enzyme
MFKGITMSDFHIDRATPNDLNAMIELLQTLFTIEADFTPQPQRQRVGLQMLLEEKQRAGLFVARLTSATVIGMCSTQLVISTAQGSYAVWIEDVIVAPTYRQLGVGKALLQTALQWAKQQGATRAQLLVDQTNRSALQFYHRLGWRETKLQARHYFFTELGHVSS